MAARRQRTPVIAELLLRPVFIVPGATQSGAMLDLGRAVVRRAERHAVCARACGRPTGDEVLRYLSRLPDLLSRSPFSKSTKTSSPQIRTP